MLVFAFLEGGGIAGRTYRPVVVYTIYRLLVPYHLDNYTLLSNMRYVAEKKRLQGLRPRQN